MTKFVEAATKKPIRKCVLSEGRKTPVKKLIYLVAGCMFSKYELPRIKSCLYSQYFIGTTLFNK